jgi:1,4-alpha-glucan branching enzyme
LRETTGKYLFTFYQALIGLRRANAGLRSPNIDVFFVHNDHRLIAFRRWDESQEFLVFASLNNAAFDRPSYLFHTARIPAGNWREVFNSDAAIFGGKNVGNAGATIGGPQGSFECVVPANGFVVFQRVIILY